MLKKGLVQIYTGDGKGKTTAAMGLALRSAGAGLKVLIYQFLKPPKLELSEKTAILKSQLDIQMHALEYDWDMRRSFDDPDAINVVKSLINKALGEIGILANRGDFDVIILDEIVFCCSKGLAEIKDIRNLLKNRDNHVEIVMTGRGATEELIELADLVSEVKLVKHPYNNGINGRKGIEF
jgi:cob(I)alamin adenosyltransferase